MTRGFIRIVRGCLLLFCAVLLVAPDVADAAARHVRIKSHVRTHRSSHLLGVNDPRYAALIMNPETGEVYHQQSADASRYPASLTKMMTLYLLFDALQKGKIDLDTQLRVSDYATTMPQTNLALSTDDRVPVEVAIRALIIRSANDVAVVVAENLGGSVENFAQMMTAKARALGMNNTTFRNPNGLPDSRQMTTARDLAKLAIALRRDFPDYYDYFGDRSFSWRGVTYYTHNRVMLRYSGTDGLKTGYTLAAGFNLVTSAARGGRRLIGVVMGGSTGNWRDDRMIALMNQGYTTMSQRSKNSRLYADNLPLQRNGLRMGEVPPPPPTQTAQADGTVVTMPAPDVSQNIAPDVTQQLSAPAETPVKVQSPVKVDLSKVKADRGIVHEAVTPTTKKVVAPDVVTPKTPMPKTVVVPDSAAPINLGKTTTGGDWGIQVGAFSSKMLAEQAALQSFQMAPDNLQGSRISVVGTGPAGAMVHRARLENITQDQAKHACQVLVSKNSPCFIFRTGAQNL